MKRRNGTVPMLSPKLQEVDTFLTRLAVHLAEYAREKKISLEALSVTFTRTHTGFLRPLRMHAHVVEGDRTFEIDKTWPGAPGTMVG